MPAPIDHLHLAIEAVAHHSATPALWADMLKPFMLAGGISTHRRIAAFIGQCAIESGGFTTLEENLNYSAERLCAVWPSHFESAVCVDAQFCAHEPEKIANVVYSNRMGNGDAMSGDGWLFRGAGLLQLTGREMQCRFALSAKITEATVGNYLRTPRGAAQSAVWFWGLGPERGANPNLWADGWYISTITRHINGGMNGAQERLDASNAALRAIEA